RDGLKDRVLKRGIAVRLKKVGAGRDGNRESRGRINSVYIAKAARKTFGVLLTDVGEAAARTSRPHRPTNRRHRVKKVLLRVCRVEWVSQHIELKVRNRQHHIRFGRVGEAG